MKLVKPANYAYKALAVVGTKRQENGSHRRRRVRDGYPTVGQRPCTDDEPLPEGVSHSEGSSSRRALLTTTVGV